MKLVGRRDEQDRVVLGGQTRQVLLLAPAPRRLGVGVRVGATLDYPAHLGPKTPDCRASSLGRLAVLDRVVEQGGDRLVLVGAVLERDRAGAQEMAQVRDGRALAKLSRVDLSRGRQSLEHSSAIQPGQRWKRPSALVD